MSTAIDHALLYVLMAFFHFCYIIIIVSVVAIIVSMIVWAVNAVRCRKR